MAWDAPMSGDEYVHVKQAEKNINYLKSHGHDKEALNTPISRLKHYGQSFDTVTTIIAQVFSIDDLYRFRHLSNAVIAWLIIVFTSLLSIQLTKSKVAGIITIILMLITARFTGHAMNNLKDIPFTFSFIFSIYFMFRFFDGLPKITWINIVFIVLGIAFGISIRIGGILILAYFILFTFLWIYYIFQRGEITSVTLPSLSSRLVGLFILVFVSSNFLGILLWPWALESFISNPWESLTLMSHYPTTVRQVFEGQLYWSDQFPWYYLFKYLLITLPLVVLLGLIAIFIWRIKEPNAFVKSIFVLIAFGFPLFYASVIGANVYGGWRQMMFVFPPLIVMSAAGIWGLYQSLKLRKVTKIIGVMVLILLLINPVFYVIRNFPYQYTFFNPLVGGIQGAYGQYELDYYFTSFNKAYDFIDKSLDDKPGIVAANFVIPEYYEDKSYSSRLIDYYNRSADDWDYAIICNTFLDPRQLRNGPWPPNNTIYTVEIDDRPILAILKRESKSDLEGIRNLKSGDFSKAIIQLNEALKVDSNNESILLNLARAYFYHGEISKALVTIDSLLSIYPDNEWAKDLHGEILFSQGRYEEAISFFSENVNYNYKFFHSYVNLAKSYLAINQENNAVDQLKACLYINPFYTPAYHIYGQIKINNGEVELGTKMLNYKNEGNSKYGRR